MGCPLAFVGVGCLVMPVPSFPALSNVQNAAFGCGLSMQVLIHPLLLPSVGVCWPPTPALVGVHYPAGRYCAGRLGTRWENMCRQSWLISSVMWGTAGGPWPGWVWGCLEELVEPEHHPEDACCWAIFNGSEQPR